MAGVLFALVPLYCAARRKMPAQRLIQEQLDRNVKRSCVLLALAPHGVLPPLVDDNSNLCLCRLR